MTLPNQSFKIGRRIADFARLRAFDGERWSPLTPRMAQVLFVLIEHAEKAVTRQHLLDTVWSDASVGDETLSRAIADLRKAFGDCARKPKLIQTVPRVGYKLLESVESAGMREAKSARRGQWIRAAVTATILGSIGIAWAASRLSDQGAESTLSFYPLVGTEAIEHSPQLSRDGETLYYASVDKYAAGHEPASRLLARSLDSQTVTVLAEADGTVMTGMAVAEGHERLAYALSDGFDCRVIVRDGDADAQEVGRCGRTPDVQFMAWASDCLFYTGYVDVRRSRLQSWCAVADGPVTVPSAFDTALDYEETTQTLLITDRAREVALWSLESGAIRRIEVDGLVRDGAFGGNGAVTVLLDEKGTSNVRTFRSNDLTPVEARAAVPHSQFLSRNPGSDEMVMGTFGWPRRLSVFDPSTGDIRELLPSSHRDFVALSIAADKSRLVFLRTGRGGWQAWSLNLTTQRLTQISKEGERVTGVVALSNQTVLAVSPARRFSQLIAVDPDSGKREILTDLPYGVHQMVRGPDDSFAAQCFSHEFQGLCRWQDGEFQQWLIEGHSASWDEIASVWHAATDNRVLRYENGRFRFVYELPAAQSVAAWFVRGSQIYALTRDPRSKTAVLFRDDLHGPSNRTEFSVNSDGFNLDMAADGQIYFAETLFERGQADLYLAAVDSP